MRDTVKTALIAATFGFVGSMLPATARAVGTLLAVPQSDGTTLYFGRATIGNGEYLKRNGANIDSAPGGPGGGAPTTSDYLVKTADGGLSAERVVTDTASIVWNWGTAGQAKGDVQFGTSSTTACVGDDARLSDARTPVTHSMASHTDEGALATLNAVGSSEITDGSVALADMANLAQDQFIVRTTASTGVPETATVTAYARTILDDTNATNARATLLLGSAATSNTADFDAAGAASAAQAASQPLDADLTSIAALTTTAQGLALLDDATQSDQRSTLGLGTLATQSGTFSGTSSGTNTGDQTITLTGNVTGTGTGSFATTIADGVVSLAKMANLTQDSFIIRTTASTGVPETATCTAAARTVLDDTTTDAMLGTLGAWRVLRKDSNQTGIGTSATDVTSLTVAVTSGQRIRFRAMLLTQSSATGIGAMVSVNGPTASPVSFQRFEWTSATVRAPGTMATALDAFTAQTAGPGSTTVMYEIHGFAKFSANGTFAIRIKAESGGTCSVMEGSWMEYDLQ